MPSAGDEHWAPDHVVLARRVLSYVGRLFAERDATGEVLDYSPLADMAAVEQRYPAWALGPFSRIEPEFELPDSPGIFALVTAGTVRYVGASNDLADTFGVRKGLGHVSRRDCQSSRSEERCRLNRLITSEAQANRAVDVYVLAMEKRRWYQGRSGETPEGVREEIAEVNHGDWHPPK